MVLTLDTPVVGTKYDRGPSVWESVDESMLRVNFPERQAGADASAKAMDLGFDDIDRIARITGLPVVVKGVLHPEDAAACVEAGASAVWISNHGGRQLDRAVSTAGVLSEVASAVRAAGDGRSQTYVDGGIRCGLDVLAALSLGADCVFIGRLPLWALVEGVDGVSRMYDELERQLVEALRLVGAVTPRSVREAGALPHQEPL